LLTNEEADLSSEPDGAFALWQTLESASFAWCRVKGKRGSSSNWSASPDWALEVVSKTSIQKDTKLLRDRYWARQHRRILAHRRPQGQDRFSDPDPRCFRVRPRGKKRRVAKIPDLRRLVSPDAPDVAGSISGNILWKMKKNR